MRRGEYRATKKEKKRHEGRHVNDIEWTIYIKSEGKDRKLA